jgi:hypothetical protein
MFVLSSYVLCIYTTSVQKISPPTMTDTTDIYPMKDGGDICSNIEIFYKVPKCIRYT